MKHLRFDLLLHSLGFVALMLFILFGIGLMMRSSSEHLATGNTVSAVTQVCDSDTELCLYDCDDHNPDVHPGAREICDAMDNNCDGTIDEGCPTQLSPPTYAVDRAIMDMVQAVRLSLELFK